MQSRFAFLRLLALLLAMTLAVPVSVIATGTASAQGEPEFNEVPYADGQWELGRRLDESQLRYCVDPRDSDWELAAAIADAIAGALLLEPVQYVVQKEMILEDISKVYKLMLENCDVHMGFKLIPEGYAQWVSLTRAYYESEYVFVTTDPTLKSLADLPPGRTIGATIGTSGHIRLISYNAALPPEKRWRAFPYGTGDLALESLINGAVDVALVWAPELWGKQRSDPAYAGLRVIDPAPLPSTKLGVGAIVLANQTFLRNAIDEAIVALTADGTLEGILETFEFPGTAAP